MTQEIILDGRRVVSLEAFFEEFDRVALSTEYWGRNLDAFNDVLRGGFGTPPEGFTLRWADSAASRELLGYPETVRQIERGLARCHPSARAEGERRLGQARQGIGPTVFDWLVEIIAIHGPGGAEAEDKVLLVLD
jgi:RNAse (barnase) inhibitor barstar